jgi:dihydrofolate reductase
MRKLKLQVQISVDGFICGPNGEMDWLTYPWTDDISQYVDEITGPVDTILLGRKLAQGFIPHWAAVAANPDNPEYSAGKKYSDTPKVVFSKTLHTSEWANTVIAKGDMVKEVRELKSQPGGDIIVYGGSAFVSSLIKENLIDEFHLFVNPAVIGAGMPIFQHIKEKVKLTPQGTTTFACGITVMKYGLNQK